MFCGSKTLALGSGSEDLVINTSANSVIALSLNRFNVKLLLLPHVWNNLMNADMGIGCYLFIGFTIPDFTNATLSR